MSQRFKLRSFLRRTMNKVAAPKEKERSKERLADERPPGAEHADVHGDVHAGVDEASASLPSLPTGVDDGPPSTDETRLVDERAAMERTVSELVHNVEGKKQEIAALKMEVKRLKDQVLPSAEGPPGGGGGGPPAAADSAAPQLAEQLQLLRAENAALRGRLQQQQQQQPPAAAGAPISDAEKQLLRDRGVRCSCSAPASITGDDKGRELGRSASQDLMADTPHTPDWDKQSSSSISEYSVADLQDRITQMEETHHSTNEELQATLQELTDLQDQLAALQDDNKQLLQQKAVLFESLCEQTERLEDSKQQVQQLRQLLIKEEADRPKLQEREVMLQDLIKGAHAERDALQSRLDGLQEQLEARREAEAAHEAEKAALQDRLRLLESTVEAATAERRQVEGQLQEARHEASHAQIEADRVQELLDSANSKIAELQQAAAANNKSELEALLDAVRQEKNRVDERAARLQETVSRAQCEKATLEEQVASLQQENKVAKNNAKKELSDAQYRYDQLAEEKAAVVAASEQLQQSILELEATCQSHLEDKRELKASLSEQQKRAAELQERVRCLEADVAEATDKHRQACEEWAQFQADLLMSVRVANDFRTEAQEHVEKMALDNHRLRERVSALSSDLEKARAAAAVPPSPPAPTGPPSPGGERRPLRTVQSPADGRQTRPGLMTRQDSKLCVKTLIETIESANKQAKAESRSSSQSSLNSEPQHQHPRLTASASSPLFPAPALRAGADSSGTAPVTSPGLRPFSRSYTAYRAERRSDSLFSKASTDSSKSSQLKTEEGKPLTSILANKLDPSLRRSSYGDQLDKKDPLAPLVKKGGSKRNALLKWCQNKTIGYRDVDITNFSSSWNDGMALCALLHSFMPDKVPYDQLKPGDKRRNFNAAFEAAETVGIPTTLNTNDMVSQDRPDWQQVLAYVTSIYKHFET
ncbi:cytospin-A-like isoform X3 [Amphibalanus amphitrite]|uniref:cytospin-A-like isoform X3 n=1 Tax=Amphibalanus amphitrite TaxID=1232801 RepID=UPI001C90638A|nr:cytospin-A-like isoform X3 [Amphibalanus amphitrite]XP_043227044.1 cytospin-A-like isoform X3 [Amphibalanus amphitrite]